MVKDAGVQRTCVAGRKGGREDVRYLVEGYALWFVGVFQEVFVDHVKVLNALRMALQGAVEGGQYTDVYVVELKFDLWTNLPQKEFNLSFAKECFPWFLIIGEATIAMPWRRQ